MGQNSKKVALLIKEIANGKQGLSFPCMSGVVVAGSYDDGGKTVKVLLDVNDASAPTGGININVVLNNAAGVYMVPADGAYCLVAEVNGPGGRWELLKASSYVKVVVQAGTLIQFNDGSLGGLTKTLELQKQINKLNTLVSHLVTIINGANIPEPGSGAASALQAALKGAIAADSVGDFSNIENKKITH